MSYTENTSAILLTYKGKILLMLFENNPLILDNPSLLKQNAWKFIGGVKKAHESFLDAIVRKVKGITSINLKTVDLLSTILTNTEKKYLYHACLSDHDVNNIVRAEGFLLQFYSFKEVEKLPLSPSTKLFISKHRGFIEGVQKNSVIN